MLIMCTKRIFLNRTTTSGHALLVSQRELVKKKYGEYGWLVLRLSFVLAEPLCCACGNN
jgi:hypothetical protein